jgi:hypothetical protein
MCVLNQGAHTYFSKKIFWKKKLEEFIDTRLQYVQNINTHYLHEKTVWNIAHDSWVLLCPISDVILRKYWKRDSTLWWTTAQEIFVAKRKQTVTICYTGYTYTIRRTGVFDQEICVKACKRRWLCVETFNIIRNGDLVTMLVTKTDSMGLNKRHRHWYCIMAIPAMLCFIAWVISLCTCHVYFTLRNGVVYFKMKLWLYGYILDNMKTQLSCAILQTVFSCKYYVFLFCKYCSLISIILE